MPLIVVRNSRKRALVSMGLLKSGNQTVPQNVATVLDPMVVDGDYPATVLSGSSGFVANAAGEWQVSAQCTWNTSDNNRTFRLLKNGSSISSTASGTSSVTVQGLSVARLAVVDGDVLKVDALSTTLTSTARVVQGGVGTFLRAKAIPEGSPADVGMNKSTAQAFTYNAYEQVASGWVADAGKAGSQVSGNGLVMTGTGNVTATVSVTHSNTSSATGVRIRKNGSLVQEFTTSGTFHTVTGGTAIPFSVVAGDVLTVDFMIADLSTRNVTAASLFTTISM